MRVDEEAPKSLTQRIFEKFLTNIKAESDLGEDFAEKLNDLIVSTSLGSEAEIVNFIKGEEASE